MGIDGGGWTLVWKHSYMETSPLSTNMYYYRGGGSNFILVRQKGHAHAGVKAVDKCS